MNLLLTPGERQFRYLCYLTAFVFVGYLGLAFAYLFRFAKYDASQMAFQSALEFTPVLIIGLCYMFITFTCGEFFGLLRYQFAATKAELKGENLRRIATRSLGIFFVTIICFYFLRPNLDEDILEKVFLIFTPTFLGSYLMFILYKLNQTHLLTQWYFKLKFALLLICIISQLIANIVLFFPDFVAKIPNIE